jgi:hypothetical protein
MCKNINNSNNFLFENRIIFFADGVSGASNLSSAPETAPGISTSENDLLKRAERATKNLNDAKELKKRMAVVNENEKQSQTEKNQSTRALVADLLPQGIIDADTRRKQQLTQNAESILNQFLQGLPSDESLTDKSLDSLGGTLLDFYKGLNPKDQNLLGKSMLLETPGTVFTVTFNGLDDVQVNFSQKTD